MNQDTLLNFPFLRIDATSRPQWLRPSHYWKYRGLLYLFVWRDLKLRYKHTVLGYLWVVFQPYVLLAVCSAVLSSVIKAPSTNVPYPLLVLLGLLPWQLFSSSMNQCTKCLLAHQSLIKKIYFPRILIPLSLVTLALVDCFAAMPILGPLLLYYNIKLDASLLYAPLFLCLGVLYSLGVGIWLSVITVKLRDVHHTIPFFTQAYFLITPIAYPSELFSKKVYAFMALNPLTSVIEGLRWSVLHTTAPSASALFLSVAVTALLLVSGFWYFHIVEPTLDDIL